MTLGNFTITRDRWVELGELIGTVGDGEYTVQNVGLYPLGVAESEDVPTVSGFVVVPKKVFIFKNTGKKLYFRSHNSGSVVAVGDSL